MGTVTLQPGPVIVDDTTHFPNLIPYTAATAPSLAAIHRRQNNNGTNTPPADGNEMERTPLSVFTFIIAVALFIIVVAFVLLRIFIRNRRLRRLGLVPDGGMWGAPWGPAGRFALPGGLTALDGKDSLPEPRLWTVKMPRGEEKDRKGEKKGEATGELVPIRWEDIMPISVSIPPSHLPFPPTLNKSDRPSTPTIHARTPYDLNDPLAHVYPPRDGNGIPVPGNNQPRRTLRERIRGTWMDFREQMPPAALVFPPLGMVILLVSYIRENRQRRTRAAREDAEQAPATSAAAEPATSGVAPSTSDGNSNANGVGAATPPADMTDSDAALFRELIEPSTAHQPFPSLINVTVLLRMPHPGTVFRSPKTVTSKSLSEGTPLGVEKPVAAPEDSDGSAPSAVKRRSSIRSLSSVRTARTSGTNQSAKTLAEERRAAFFSSMVADAEGAGAGATKGKASIDAGAGAVAGAGARDGSGEDAGEEELELEEILNDGNASDIQDEGGDDEDEEEEELPELVFGTATTPIFSLLPTRKVSSTSSAAATSTSSPTPAHPSPASLFSLFLLVRDTKATVLEREKKEKSPGGAAEKNEEEETDGEDEPSGGNGNGDGSASAGAGAGGVASSGAVAAAVASNAETRAGAETSMAVAAEVVGASAGPSADANARSSSNGGAAAGAADSTATGTGVSS